MAREADFGVEIGLYAKLQTLHARKQRNKHPVEASKREVDERPFQNILAPANVKRYFIGSKKKTRETLKTDIQVQKESPKSPFWRALTAS